MRDETDTEQLMESSFYSQGAGIETRAAHYPNPKLTDIGDSLDIKADEAINK